MKLTLSSPRTGQVTGADPVGAGGGGGGGGGAGRSLHFLGIMNSIHEV